MEIAGENSAAWEYLTRSAAFCVSYSRLACGIRQGSGRFQRLFVVGLREPVRIVWLLELMVTVSWVNKAVHPASQSCPIEMREVRPSSGNKWTRVAVAGSDVIGRWPV